MVIIFIFAPLTWQESVKSGEDDLIAQAYLESEEVIYMHQMYFIAKGK